MASRPPSPRIPPLGPDERTAEADELLGQVAMPDASASNIFTTLVRHPGLFRRWLPFAGKMLAGKLPPRLRELAILRTGWRCRAQYEWGHHVVLARAVGVTDEEIARVCAGPDAPGWDETDALVVRAADELHDDACITDSTWRGLADRLDERQLIELVVLVGQYHLVSFTLNSLGVELEPGVPGFDE